MYVQREARLVYLAHPRTASRATAQALCEQAGFEPVGEHHGRRTDEVPAAEGWRALTTVRCHHDAVVSWYCYRYRTQAWENPLEHRPLTPEWLRRETKPWQGTYIRLDTGWLFTHLHLLDADAVIRYETLEEDLNGELTQRGLGRVQLPEVGKSPLRRGRPYQAFYDAETRRAVEEVFGGEMRRLGYEWQDLSEDPRRGGGSDAGDGSIRTAAAAVDQGAV